MRRFLLCLTPLFALAQAPAPTVEPGRVNFYSVEKEVALGRSLADDVRRQATPVESAAALAYLNRVGPAILAQFQGPFQLHFDLILSGSPGEYLEPQTLPGGFLFVSTSLFTDAKNESEFVGILAHSIAHVAARHGTRLATRNQSAQVGTIPLVFVGL